MSKLIYNPTHREVNYFYDNSKVVMISENQAKEVPNDVADFLLKEFSYLEDISPKPDTKAVEREMIEIKNETKKLSEELNEAKCPRCSRQFKNKHGLKIHANKCKI